MNRENLCKKLCLSSLFLIIFFLRVVIVPVVHLATYSNCGTTHLRIYSSTEVAAVYVYLYLLRL